MIYNFSICVCIYIYIYTHTYTHIHTYTHTQFESYMTVQQTTLNFHMAKNIKRDTWTSLYFLPFRYFLFSFISLIPIYCLHYTYTTSAISEVLETLFSLMIFLSVLWIGLFPLIYIMFTGFYFCRHKIALTHTQ